MTDECDIDVDVDDGTPIDVDVSVVPPLDVDVGVRTAIDVEPTPPTALAVDIEDALPIDVEPQEIDEIDVGTSEPDQIDVIVEAILGLTLSEYQRLYSKVFGEAPGKAPIEVWAIDEQYTDVAGDSVQWVITNTELEIARGVITAPLFRNRGILDIDIGGSFENTSGVPFTYIVRVKSMPWPNTTFPEVWTTELALTSDGVPDGGFGVTSFEAKIRASGHTGAAFKQNVLALFLATNAPSGLMGVDPLNGTFRGGDIAINTSVDRMFCITVEGNGLIANQDLTITSTHAHLSGYEIVAGNP